MTEERQPDSMVGGEGTPGEPPAGTGPQTVEEVEAFWKYRQSQADKAHAAEVAALKAQNDALKAAPAKPPEGESPEQTRVRELESALLQERSARQAAELRSTYPMTASVLGDDIVRLADTPEKLAALEAGYEQGGPQGAPLRMDPNAARRSAPGTPGAMTTQKPLNEKTKEELLVDLARTAPAFQQAQRDGLNP